MKKFFSILLAAALLLGLPAAALADGERNYSELVTDAYFTQYDFDGYAAEYHIPKVAMEGAGVAALNAAIWVDLYDGYMYDVQSSYEDGGWSFTLGITYDWAVNGDVLSIWAVAEGDTDMDTYYIYNMSLSTGERMSDRELFEAAGVTRDQFNDLARTAISASFDQFAGSVDAGFVEEQRARSVADENIALAKPYIGRGGSLCAVAWQYAIAGADRYLHTFTLIPGDMQAQLDYFIEHSGDQYLTRADIDGFDAKMCLYARNSIYARLGWKFESPELQEYFSQFDWYTPTLDPSQFTADMLSDCQRANVDLVLAYEAEQGY